MSDKIGGCVRCGNCRKFWCSENIDGVRYGYCDEFPGPTICEDDHCDGAAFIPVNSVENFSK